MANAVIDASSRVFTVVTYSNVNDANHTSNIWMLTVRGTTGLITPNHPPPMDSDRMAHPVRQPRTGGSEHGDSLVTSSRNQVVATLHQRTSSTPNTGSRRARRHAVPHTDHFQSVLSLRGAVYWQEHAT